MCGPWMHWALMDSGVAGAGRCVNLSPVLSQIFNFSTFDFNCTMEPCPDAGFQLSSTEFSEVASLATRATPFTPAASSSYTPTTPNNDAPASPTFLHSEPLPISSPPSYNQARIEAQSSTDARRAGIKWITVECVEDDVCGVPRTHSHIIILLTLVPYRNLALDLGSLLSQFLLLQRPANLKTLSNPYPKCQSSMESCPNST